MIKVINEDANINSDEYRQQIEDHYNDPAYQEMNKICSENGYSLVTAYNTRYSEGGKNYPTITIRPDGSNKYAPEIYTPKGGRNSEGWGIQTTSYGSLSPQEIVKFVDAYSKAAKMVSELEKFDLDKLPVIVDKEEI